MLCTCDSGHAPFVTPASRRCGARTEEFEVHQIGAYEAREGQGSVDHLLGGMSDPQQQMGDAWSHLQKNDRERANRLAE